MYNNFENNTPVVDVRPLRLQVAGHQSQDGRNLGILEEDDGKYVLKPLNGDKELEFYKCVFDDECVNPIIITLRQFVPKFYGVRTIESRSDSTPSCFRYLKLDNFTYGFENASVMDVKIGRNTSEPDASSGKKEREKLKYQKTKSTLGFCVPGMKVYNPSTNTRDEYDKNFGKSLDEVTVKLALRTFLGEDKSNRLRLAKAFLDEMQLIHEWFCIQRVFNFFASSLLFVYSSNNGVIRRTTTVPRIHLVDFVHFIKSDVQDDNFLFGLSNLMEAMNEILIE